jgi:hypothetical protein
MKKGVFLREYPTNEEPSVISVNPIYLKGGGHIEEREKRIDKHLNDVSDFFQRIGLKTIRIMNRIEGSFQDEQNRNVTIIFYYDENPFIKKSLGIRIEGETKTRYKSTFIKLYRQTPYIVIQSVN